MILAFPEIAGTTEMIAPIAGARRRIGRATPGASIPRVAMTALDAQITPDLGPGDIADKSATNEADRAGRNRPGNSSYGGVRKPLLRFGSNGREDDCDGDDG
jgi:hypothetical protein